MYIYIYVYIYIYICIYICWQQCFVVCQCSLTNFHPYWCRFLWLVPPPTQPPCLALALSLTHKHTQFSHFLLACKLVVSRTGTRHTVTPIQRRNAVCFALCVAACARYIVRSCARISYGVATMSRLLKIVGLFCRISSLL